MNPFSSLLSKLLFRLFLNLVLVAGVFAGFFTFQSQWDLDWVFGRRSIDRMWVAGRLISHELNSAARSEWSSVLTRHSEIHQVAFALVLEDGTQFLSRPMTIPAIVLETAVGHFAPKPLPGWRPQRPDEPMSPAPPAHSILDEKDGLREPLNPKKKPPHLRKEPFGEKPRHMMRTKNPTQYWGRMMIPISFPIAGDGPPELGLLLAESESITGNGFFFDPFPWMMVAGVVLLISVGLWLPMARNITRPLLRMTHAAEEIAMGRFHIRMGEPGADEIGRLGTAINHMTSRLDGLIKGQKRFLGDVAHELSSPIARIQLGLGILEQHVAPDNRQRVADVIEDVVHMSHLVSDLLSFSKAEMDPAAIKPTATALLPIVERAVDREKTAASEILLQIDAQIRVIASEELLFRALSNLLRNAIRYAGDAGPVVVAAERRKDRVTIEVRDVGPGVPEALLDQIFEPFYRPELSRSQATGGIGLGLAIVKTAIEACKGRVAARNIKPIGFAVTVTLTEAD